MRGTIERADKSSPRTRGADPDPDYCPECGRLWNVAVDAGRLESKSIGWWPGLMVVVGIYLTVTFGSRAWDAVYASVTRQPIATTRCLTTGTEQDYATCDPAQARSVGVVAMACLLIGLGAFARPKMLERRRLAFASRGATDGATTYDSLVGMGLKVWGTVETLGRSLSLLLCVFFFYVGSSRVLAGVPLTVELIPSSIDRTLEVVAAALRIR